MNTTMKVVLGVVAIFAIMFVSAIGISAVIAKDVKVKTVQEELDAALKEKNHLANRVKELDAVSTKSKEDISNYIQTYHKTVGPVVAEAIANEILTASNTHDVPFVSLVAVNEVESRFNPAARGKARERGLMQIIYPIWGKWLGLKSKYDLHNIRTNIDSGSRILRKHLNDADNNMKNALCMYNTGKKCKKGGDIEYVTKVYKSMGRFVMYRSFANLKVQEQTIENPLITITEAKEKQKPKQFVHEVKYYGEMLGTISKWYTGEISNWKKILEANPHIKDVLKIQIGDKITIPDTLLDNISPLAKEFVTEYSNK